MRQAKLVAEAVAVLCPFCEETQPHKSGSEMWTVTEIMEVVGKRAVCASCGEQYTINDNKALLS